MKVKSTAFKEITDEEFEYNDNIISQIKYIDMNKYINDIYNAVYFGSDDKIRDTRDQMIDALKELQELVSKIKC